MLATFFSLGVHAVAFAAMLSFEPGSRSKPAETVIDLVDLSFGFDVKPVEVVAKIAPAKPVEAAKAVKPIKTAKRADPKPAENVRPKAKKIPDKPVRRLEKAETVLAKPVRGPKPEKVPAAPVRPKAQNMASAATSLKPSAVDGHRKARPRRDRVQPSESKIEKPVPVGNAVVPRKAGNVAKPALVQPRTSVVPNRPLPGNAADSAALAAKSPSGTRLQVARKPLAATPAPVSTPKTVNPLLKAPGTNLARNAPNRIAAKPAGSFKALKVPQAPKALVQARQGPKAPRTEAAATVAATKPVSDTVSTAAVAVAPIVSVETVSVSSPAPAKPVQTDSPTRVAALPPKAAPLISSDKTGTGSGLGLVPLEALQTFESGECMLILPRGADQARRSFAAFGIVPDAAQRFQREMERRHAVDLSVYMRSLTDAQCAATEFVRSLPSYPLFSMRIDVDRDVIKSGETLTGRVRGAAGQLSLILVDDDGMAWNVNRFLSIVDYDVHLSAPMHVTGRKIRTVQMLVAIATPQALATLADRHPRRAKKLFRQLNEELRAKNMSIDVAVTAFRVE